MELWTSQSNSGKQTALAVACSATGLILLSGFHNFSVLGSNAMAGFLLGVLLLLIGVAGYLVSGKQTVVIDPYTRRITVEDSNRIGTRSRSIQFDDIVDVQVGYLGKKSSFVMFYYLVLKLRNGEEYSLFSPGKFYEGGSEKFTVEAWHQRLKAYLGQS